MKLTHVVTSFQMKQLDYQTMESKHINSLELMIHAGNCMAESIVNMDLVTKKDSLLVVAGIGNNGGDALVIASSLIKRGIHCDIVLIGDVEHQSIESQHMIEKMES